VAGPMKGADPVKEFWPLQPVKIARQTSGATSRAQTMIRMASFLRKKYRKIGRRPERDEKSLT
jgi:hypothetical protein